MSLQNRPLRSSLTSIAITGAAALATVLAGAPAMADDAVVDPTDSTQTPESEEPAAEPEPTEATPAPEATDGAEESTPDEETAPVDESDDATADDESADAPAQEPREKRLAAAAADGEVVADFGYKKFRVGVQVADGSFVPEGGTVGSTFTITISDGEGGSREIECTTEDVLGDPDTNPDGFSICPGENGLIELPPELPLGLARSVEITDSIPIPVYTYMLEPGETATIVQTSSVPGLEVSADTAVLSPCVTGEESDNCGDDIATADVRFDDEGTPPDAVDDSATTDEGDAVDIDLLANDDPSIAPITGVTLDSQVQNGTVEIDDAGVATYTPDADFSGTETFTYALSTQNGSDAATVTVEVEADAVAPVADEVDPPKIADVSSALPNTGGPDLSLAGYGALLLAGGGWLTLRSRRRVGTADRG